MKFKQRLEGQEGSRFLGERMFLAKEALSAKAPRQECKGPEAGMEQQQPGGQRGWAEFKRSAF